MFTHPPTPSMVVIKTVIQILEQHPAGITEYQLIQELRKQELEVFVKADLQEPLSLFQTHFLLFHLLYQLRDQLHAQQLATLEIHTLSIRLTPWREGAEGLCVQDKLREYYLDISQLESTDREAVEELLSFSQLRLSQQDSAQEALIALGFAAAPSTPCAQQIQTRYRQLVSQHHPDRGGCTVQVQALNSAYETLKKQGYLRQS